MLSAVPAAVPGPCDARAAADASVIDVTESAAAHRLIPDVMTTSFNEPIEIRATVYAGFSLVRIVRGWQFGRMAAWRKLS